MSLQKIKAVESDAIRKSAKGEDCTLNIVGVCNYDPSTVVLAHFPSEFAHTKSSDLSAGYGCNLCHDVIDRRNTKFRLSKEDRQFYMRRSQDRTIHRLNEKGIITIKGHEV